jgi:hypothetical protein
VSKAVFGGTSQVSLDPGAVCWAFVTKRVWPVLRELAAAGAVFALTVLGGYMVSEPLLLMMMVVLMMTMIR